jgi:hypothetical protein
MRRNGAYWLAFATVTSVSPRCDDGLRVTEDRDHSDARLRAELALRERLADPRARLRHLDPLDQELSERHLEVLDDLRALVRPADDGAQLARFVVVERDHGGRLVLAPAPEPVQLALAVVVQDHGQAAAALEREDELRADAGQPRLFEVRSHQAASLGTGNRRRPSAFDSFISTMPRVAVTRT